MLVPRSFGTGKSLGQCFLGGSEFVNTAAFKGLRFEPLKIYLPSCVIEDTVYKFTSTHVTPPKVY